MDSLSPWDLWKGREGKESFKKIKVDFFVAICESKIKKTEPVAVVFPSPQLTWIAWWRSFPRSSLGPSGKEAKFICRLHLLLLRCNALQVHVINCNEIEPWNLAAKPRCMDVNRWIIHGMAPENNRKLIIVQGIWIIEGFTISACLSLQLISHNVNDDKIIAGHCRTIAVIAVYTISVVSRERLVSRNSQWNEMRGSTRYWLVSRSMVAWLQCPLNTLKFLIPLDVANWWAGSLCRFKWHT